MSRLLRAYARSPLLPLTAAMMAIVGLLLGPGAGLKCTKTASAANGQLPTDYCYVVAIDFKHSGTSTVTDVAVRIPTAQGFNAKGLISSGAMDAEAWDAHPTTASFAETDLLAQDITSATAAWWFHVPSAAVNSTVTIDLYFGSDIQRDQGILFTGGDSVTVAHHSDFNIADSLTLAVEVELLSTSAQTATLAGHRNGSAGYSVGLVNSSGLAIQAQADGQTCTLAWPTGNIPVGETATIDVTFNNPNLAVTIYGSDGTQEGTTTCNTGLGSITATSTALTVGTSLNQAIIRDVKLMNGSATNLHWGFNPSAMTETSAVNPVYQGTVTDESPQGHNGTYTFNRDQTNWSVTIGGFREVSAGSAIPPTPNASVNLLGSNQFGINLNITATPAADTFSRLFGASVQSYIDQGGNRNFGWTAFFITAAIGFALIGWTLWRYIPAAILIAGIPLVYGLVKQYVPGFVVIIWAAFTILSWLAIRRGESAGG